ncbi:MAG: hypothetical protein DRH21_03455 [Deltaproteobacteria bacterium]|nr:MAG: hypothetical protein DRH21_03455 [Deltaproteobacteria bacterium]
MNFRFFTLFLSVVLLSSCYPEYKLAKSYIDSEPDNSIMILPIDYLFKSNLKIEELGDTAGMSEWEIDSALMDNSIFLKDISDSIVLETFINSLMMEFEKLGFAVYTEDYIDSFLFFQSPAYILNIAQLELEEHSFEFEDSELIRGIEYYKKLQLNAININTWLEISALNADEEGRELFYANETIADIVDGHFGENLFTGKVKYNYRIVKMDEEIIYRYCELLGRRYAGYTYDYIMNEYIKQNFPSNKKLRFYMHYNRENKTLDTTVEDRFVEMEE